MNLSELTNNVLILFDWSDLWTTAHDATSATRSLTFDVKSLIKIIIIIFVIKLRWTSLWDNIVMKFEFSKF